VLLFSKLIISSSISLPFYGFFIQLSLSVLFTITKKIYLALVFTFLLLLRIYVYSFLDLIFFLILMAYFNSLFTTLKVNILIQLLR